MDLKRYFSFFFFYYFLLRNKAKKYDLAMNVNTGIVVLITPVAFMLIHMIIGLALVSWVFTAFMFIHVILIPVNMIIVYKIRSEGYELERKMKEKAREAQRMQEQKERERRDKVFREWQRRAEEQDRRRRERERKQSQQEQERRQYYQQWRQSQQKRNEYSNGSTFTKSYLEQCFKTLGINGTTTDIQTVKKAYRRAAKIHHPDKGGDSKMFIKVKESYDYILKNIS